MKYLKFYKSVSPLVLSSAILVAFPNVSAHAQQASTSSNEPQAAKNNTEGGDSDIIVTAQRRSESIQRVPISIIAISGSQLAEKNITSMVDFASQVPNLIINQSASSDQLYLRGFGAGYNSGFEQAVATFVDGVYRSRSRSTRVALFDIDRVEVLRGPQSLYFGANAIAGALNITTRKPTDLFEGNASASYGLPYGDYNLEAGISVPLTEGLSMRVAGRYGGSDGYIRNTRFNSYGPHSTNGQARASLRYVNGGLSVNARYDYARVRSDGTQYEVGNCPPAGMAPGLLCGIALAQFPNLDGKIDGQTSQGYNGVSDLNFDEAGMVARYDFTNLSVISTSALTWQYADVGSEVIPLPGISVVGTESYLPAAIREGFHQFSQELRVESNLTGPFSYMIGGYFENNRTNILGLAGNFFLPFAQFIGVIPPSARVISVTDSTIRSRTWSGFASVSFKPVDALNITGGLRYSKVTKTGNRSVSFGSGGYFADAALPYVPFSPLGQTISAAVLNFSTSPYSNNGRLVDSAWMPSVRVQYDVTRDAMLYASYSRGFLAGGFGANTPDAFAPEYTDAFEVGAKLKALDGRLTFNLAAFTTNYRDLQEAYNNISPSGTTQLVIANVASSRSSGVELGMRLRVTDQLTFHADGAYLDSKYLSYPNAPCNPIEAATFAALPANAGKVCIGQLAGKRRAFAPEWSGSAGADYTNLIADSFRLGLHGSVTFSSYSYAQSLISDLVKLPGFVKFDASMSLSAPHSDLWQISLIGRNLTNRRNIVYLSYMPASLGSQIGEVASGRSVALQFSTKF